MVQSAAERKDQNKGSKLVKNKAHMGLLWFYQQTLSTTAISAKSEKMFFSAKLYNL